MELTWKQLRTTACTQVGRHLTTLACVCCSRSAQTTAPFFSTVHIAASTGNIEVLQELVRFNADVNVAHRFAHSTALHFAAEMGHADMIRLLCQLGATSSVVFFFCVVGQKKT